MTLDATLERIYPHETDPADAVESESIELHLARYRFAAVHAKGNRLLDIASGCGYGTAMLGQAKPGMECFGLDCDPRAIAYASERYPGPNLSYIQADVMEYAPQQKFDTVVTLETIEHLPDPAGFIRRLAEITTQDGIIVASVPITPSKDGNPHHLHDFTEKSFKNLFIENGFHPTEPELLQVQRYFRFSGLFSKGTKKRTQNIPRNLARFYLDHPTALFKRIGALCRYGFTNRYLTSVFRRT